MPDGSSSKELTRQCRGCKSRSNRWIRKMPWQRESQPTLIFLPGEPHGQRSLWATVYKVAKSWMQLKQLGMHARRRKALRKNNII